VPRILLTQAISDAATERLASLGEVVIADDTSACRLKELVATAHAIVVRTQLPDGIFAAAPHLLGAIRHGAGVDMIPIAQATARGILVANVPGVNAQSVAEHVVGTMIMLGRRFGRIASDLRNPQAGWAAARAHAPTGRELSGKTLGIVGFGNVGTALARICHYGLGMNVLAANRSPIPATTGVTQRDLDELLTLSDYVVLTCPLTEQTRGLINAARITRMKQGACLINVARGPVLDESALLRALQTGHLGGAGLDVFETQPLPIDHPFYRLDNVVLTPHVAGISDESMLRMGLGTVNAVASILRGERPASLVNPEAWEAFASRFAVQKH
jgi:D-3-phosphoglycerate dehydrogenase